MRSRRALVLIPAMLVLAAGVVPASANHGPTRSGTDPCNGTAAFDVNNVINPEVVDSIAAQNPGSTNPDGTIDRTKITHAVLSASGHVALQVVSKASAPLARVTFEFSRAAENWSVNSTNHPAYLTAIDASESTARDADSDLVVGKTFVFFIPTDVVADGNYVARLRGFDAAGTEVGRLCLDAVVSNTQGIDAMFPANADAEYEPSESGGVGFAPQPVLWFPAGEPAQAQRTGYASSALRIEFPESLGAIVVEREEVDPVDPLLRIWVDRSAALASDDFTRPHFLAGGRLDGTELEADANEKVWGPGFSLNLGTLPGGIPVTSQKIRITATDAVGKRFCGVYTFSPGANGSFAVSPPADC